MKLGIVGNLNSDHIYRRVQLLQTIFKDMVVITRNRYVKKPGDNFEVIDLSQKKHGFLKTFRQYWWCYKYFRESKFNCIQAFYALDPIAWVANVAAKCPLILSTMGGDVFLEEQQKITRFTRANTLTSLKDAARVTTLSLYMTERLKQLGIKSKNILLDYWGIENFWFEKADTSHTVKKYDLKNSHPIIFSPRLMQPLYNIHVILEAVKELKQQLPQIKLILSQYGSCSTYKQVIMENITNWGLQDNIVFLPEDTAREKLPPVYQVSDITVMLPPSDGMPMSLLESIASQTPVIGSDIPHYQQDSQPKFMITTGIDSKSVAREIQMLIENKQEFEKLKKDGVNFVKKYYQTPNINPKIYDGLEKISLGKLRILYRMTLIFLFLIEPWFAKLLPTRDAA